MKTGLTVSTLLHGALLGFGLIALSAPAALEVADVEAFPVDIVPVESITQIQQGNREAPVAERAAPTPTERPHTVPDARNAGENDVDLETNSNAEASRREVRTAALPESQPTPKPATPGEQVREQPKPAPTPATEVTPEPQPRQEVTPEPVEEAAVAENPEAEAIKLPENAPSPQARPQPPQAQTAKAPERRNAEEPANAPAEKPKASDTEFDLASVDNVLRNLEDAAGGGGARSSEQAALGGERTTTGEKLTQSEMDALRQQLNDCWLRPAGMSDEDLRTSVRFSLDQSGRLAGPPRIEATSGNRQFDESALRAVWKCDQAGLRVPSDRYEAWAEVLVTFDPEML
ncbi:MAG: TonB C-terminal domain-containing protein [Rhizobiaceae bacterium]|nr:TonB C-terminal domain-containing protein [Rhizobiaceae bacterium]